MWPKIIAQLIELLPHLSRLVPMADRFLQARGADDEATAEAMTALRAEIASTRVEIGKTIGTHESLYRQMNEQGERIDQAVNEVLASRMALQLSEEKLAGLEAKVSALRGLVIASCAMTAALLVLMIVFITHR